MTGEEKREALRKASPAERVAFLREYMKHIEQLEEQLVEDLDWRCRILDDIWEDLAPEDHPMGCGDVCCKVLSAGSVISEGTFQRFPWEERGSVLVGGVELKKVFPLEFSDAEISELERRLAEVSPS